jgi:hypothetical protein
MVGVIDYYTIVTLYAYKISTIYTYLECMLFMTVIWQSIYVLELFFLSRTHPFMVLPVRICSGSVKSCAEIAP